MNVRDFKVTFEDIVGDIVGEMVLPMVDYHHRVRVIVRPSLADSAVHNNCTILLLYSHGPFRSRSNSLVSLAVYLRSLAIVQISILERKVFSENTHVV